MGHTPGPWWVEKPDDPAEDKRQISDGFGNTATVHGDAETATDNANLIAAAPELLAALKDAYDALDYAQAQVDSDDDRWHLTRCRRKIKPVIDKAEGRDE
jgi:enoyl reductase-like protein